MNTASPTLEATVVRRVFPHWSVTIPATMEETFVAPDGYWHAWDLYRSVSLTSNVITDRQGRRISPRQVLKLMPPEPGTRVGMPPGLSGWAVVISQPPPARASKAISGILARKGGILIATVTADDLEWATSVWQSIKLHR